MLFKEFDQHTFHISLETGSLPLINGRASRCTKPPGTEERLLYVAKVTGPDLSSSQLKMLAMAMLDFALQHPSVHAPYYTPSPYHQTILVISYFACPEHDRDVMQDWEDYLHHTIGVGNLRAFIKTSSRRHYLVSLSVEETIYARNVTHLTSYTFVRLSGPPLDQDDALMLMGSIDQLYELYQAWDVDFQLWIKDQTFMVDVIGRPRGYPSKETLLQDFADTVGEYLFAELHHCQIMSFANN